MSEKTKSVSVALSAVVSIISLATAVIVMASDRQAVIKDVAQLKEDVLDHEARVRILERLTLEVAADVRWMRSDLESRPR